MHRVAAWVHRVAEPLVGAHATSAAARPGDEEGLCPGCNPVCTQAATPYAPQPHMHPGKSHVLGRVLSALRRVHRASRGAVAVVAPTGVAAANIGAVTLHSWAGIGLGRESKEALLARARGSHHARTRWEAARVLVVDEVGSLQPYMVQPATLCGPPSVIPMSLLWRCLL